MKLNDIERLAAVSMVLTKYLAMESLDNLHLITDGDFYVYHEDLDTSAITERDLVLLESVGAKVWDCQTIELEKEYV